MIINLVPKADVMLSTPLQSLLLNITVVMHQRKSEMEGGKEEREKQERPYRLHVFHAAFHAQMLQ